MIKNIYRGTEQNRGIGLAIEKEVLRIAFYSSYVIVMKGKMRITKTDENNITYVKYFENKGITIPLRYWKAIAACNVVGSEERFEIKCWIIENKEPEEGLTKDKCLVSCEPSR